MVAPPVTTRNGCYNDSLRFFFFATAIFLVGYGSPFWLHMENDAVVDDGIVFKETTNVSRNAGSNVSRGMTSNVKSLTSTHSVGLWMACVSVGVYNSTSCDTLHALPFSTAGWFQWVRAMECVCLLGVVTSCVFLTLLHCCNKLPEPRSRFLEVFAALSGALGFGGAMMYVVNIDEDMKARSRQMTQWSFSWGIFLTLIGSALIFVAAIAVAIFKDPVFNKVGTADRASDDDDDECDDDENTDDCEGNSALPMTHMSGYPVVVRYPAPLPGNQSSALDAYGGHPCLLDAQGELCLADRDGRESPPAYEDVERQQGPLRVPAVAGGVGQTTAGAADGAGRGQCSVTGAWWAQPASGATDARGRRPSVGDAHAGQPATVDAQRGRPATIDAQRGQLRAAADALGDRSVAADADGGQTAVIDTGP